MKKKEIEEKLSEIADSFVYYYIENADENVCISITQRIKTILEENNRKVYIKAFEISKSLLHLSFSSNNEFFEIFGTCDIENTTKQDEIDRPEVQYFRKIDIFQIHLNPKNLQSEKTLFYAGGSYECWFNLWQRLH